MLVLISCAKIMREDGERSKVSAEFSGEFTNPTYQENANFLANFLSEFEIYDLAERLKINADLVAQNYARYRQIVDGESLLEPSLFHYNGIVFKNIDPDNLSYESVLYAQNHLLICSFLYGLLRPLDVISAYRLEGKFRLDNTEFKDVFAYWKPRLTDFLIEQARSKSKGILCNLASSEMKALFDWKRVCRELKVIDFEFYTVKNGNPRTIVVHTKMARGMFTRYILENQITSVEDLKRFDMGGYSFLGERENEKENTTVLEFVKQ